MKRGRGGRTVTDEITYTCEKCGLDGIVTLYHHRRFTSCSGNLVVGTPHLRLRILGVGDDMVRFQIAEQKWRGGDFAPWISTYSIDYELGGVTLRSRECPAHGSNVLWVRGNEKHLDNRELGCPTSQFLCFARVVQSYCVRAAEWETKQNADIMDKVTRLAAIERAYVNANCGMYEAARGQKPASVMAAKASETKEMMAFEALQAQGITDSKGGVHGSDKPNSDPWCGIPGCPTVTTVLSEVTCLKCRGIAAVKAGFDREFHRVPHRCRYSKPMEIKGAVVSFDPRMDPERPDNDIGFALQKFRRLVTTTQREWPLCPHGGTVNLQVQRVDADKAVVGVYLCDRCSGTERNALP